MTIELKLQLWHLISLFLMSGGLLLTMGKFFFGYLDRRIERLTLTLGHQLKEQSQNHQRLERDFLNFKAELPDKYVRREDFIRSEAVIEAKLDGLAIKFDNMILGANHGR